MLFLFKLGMPPLPLVLQPRHHTLVTVFPHRASILLGVGARTPAEVRLVGVGPLSKLLVESAAANGCSAEKTACFSDATAAVNTVEAWGKATGMVLLKGSRGMRLEIIWDVLAARGGN